MTGNPVRSHPRMINSWCALREYPTKVSVGASPPPKKKGGFERMINGHKLLQRSRRATNHWSRCLAGARVEFIGERRNRGGVDFLWMGCEREWRASGTDLLVNIAVKFVVHGVPVSWTPGEPYLRIMSVVTRTLARTRSRQGTITSHDGRKPRSPLDHPFCEEGFPWRSLKDAFAARQLLPWWRRRTR